MPSQASQVQALRTPDARFVHLADFPFAPHYSDVPTGDGSGGELRVHYLDEGDPASPVILLMHGEPSWSFLYRHMIPLLVDSGLRAVAPDLVGFGRSDKPSERGLRLVAAEPDTGARQFPVLEQFTKPFLYAFSDSDPITGGADRALRARVPGCADQPHTTIVGGGHFLQEDRGPELARVVADFVGAS
jgi:pimeloyl-ACP methyl ester carboxylesterase